MTTNRIQKLLFSEYSEFEDIVLVESTFAETTRQGNGIRQVQIGLTPSRLILASYCVDVQDTERPRRRDPDIDCFELVSAFPVECVNLTVFHHRRRQTLKAHFCNGKVHYFEIGGWHDRWMLWAVWCERLKFLSPYDNVTSVSETSVGSSSSGSSLYIVRSALTLSQTGKTTLWCTYASSTSQEKPNRQGSWADPHVYLGPSFMEKGINFMSKPGVEKALSSVGGNLKNFTNQLSKSVPSTRVQTPLSLSLHHEKMAREAVDLWESRKPFLPKIHRRYALLPHPGVLAGLGLWELSKPQAFSLQGKKSVSLVSLTSPADQLTIPANQLTRTVSLEQLTVPAMCPDKLFEMIDDKPPDQKDLEFWTDNPSLKLEWRRKNYRSQQRLLRNFRKRSATSVFLSRGGRRGLRKRKSTVVHTSRNRLEKDAVGDVLGGAGDSCGAQGSEGQQNSDAKSPGKLSSTSIAHQLTMLDKQLFRQLSVLELARVRRDKSSTRAPHLRALVLLSHRITCLVASQVTSPSTVKERAVQMVKYVGVAYRCHKLHNLHSAASVLHGLQCPAVYRLHRTWAYVRKHHASKYRRFEDLSKRYQDPRLPLYQKTFDNLTRTPPYMPPVDLLTAILLGKLQHLPEIASAKFSVGSCTAPPLTPPGPLPQTLQKFVSMFSVYKSSSSANQSKQYKTDISSCQSETHLHAVSEDTLMDNLDKFFAPVNDSCPDQRRLQDIQYLLETSQTASARYAIPTNPQVRQFLLQTQYLHMQRLFSVSRQLEP